MWQALIKLVEKLTCCHNWEVVYTTSYTHCNKHLLRCVKCGKIKKVTL